MTKVLMGVRGLSGGMWYRLAGLLLAAVMVLILLGCESKPTVEVGSPAPNFTVTTLDGKKAQLSDFRGKAVVLNFWASWCGPCRNEIPVIEAVHQEYADQGLAIVAVNMQEQPGTVTQFVEWAGLTFPVYLDPEGEVSKAYRVRAVPTTHFIDAEGVIRASRIGEMNTEIMLDGISKATQPS